MIEIFQIFFQFFIFFLFFIFPVTPEINNRWLIGYKFNIYDLISINIVINLTIYLIITLFNFNLNYLFFINFLIAFLFLCLNFSKNINFIRNSGKLLFFFSILNISLFSGIANELILYWDGLAHWIFKASGYFQGLGTVSTGQASYPHLGSFLWGYFWKNSIIEKEYVGRLIFLFIYLSALFSLLNIFKDQTLKSHKVIFIILILLLTYDKQLFGGYQDHLLFSILLINSKFLFIIINSKNIRLFSFFIYFISIFVSLWIKQEGFVYFVIVNITLIFFEKRIINRYIYLITSSLLLILYFYLKTIFNSHVGFDQSINFEVLSKIDLNFLIFLFKEISFNIFVAIWKYPIWILIIICMTMLALDKKFFNKFRYVYFLLILNVAFIYSLLGYTCLNLGNSSCQLIMRVSMDRIILQNSAFYIIICLIFIEQFLFRIKNFYKS